MNTYWVLRDGCIECVVDARVPSDAGQVPSLTTGRQPLVTAAAGGSGKPAGGRLARRARTGLLGVSMALVLPLISAGGVAASGRPPESERLVAYTVVAGESLWSIAERFKEPGTDTRDEVDHLRRVNGMSTSNLYAGQVILVDAAS